MPQPSQRNVVQEVLPGFRGDALCKLRLDKARSDGIHQYVAGGELLGDGLGEPDDPCLRSGVIRLALVAVQPHHARNVDDATPAPLDHAARGVLGHQERALEVRIHDRIPVRLAQQKQQIVLGEPGIVDEDVDLPEVPFDRFGERFHLIAHADVAGVAARSLAEGARSLLRRRAVARAQGDLRAGVDECAADVVADPARPARDERDLSRQIELHAIPALRRGIYFPPSSDGHAASMNLVTSSAVPRLTTFASGTIRFKRPASTVPGPISTKRAPSPPRRAACCMHSTQRTAAVSWSESRRRARPASFTASAVAVATTGNAGSENSARSSASWR